jgi:hypothetical protein
VLDGVKGRVKGFFSVLEQGLYLHEIHIVEGGSTMTGRDVARRLYTSGKDTRDRRATQ